MAFPRRPLAERPYGERVTVALLRIGAGGAPVKGDMLPAAISRDDFAMFETLARMSIGRGRIILARDAPFLSEDEFNLLGAIAHRQRGALPKTRGADPEIDPIVRACAAILLRHGVRLPYAAALNAAFRDRATADPELYPRLRRPRREKAKAHAIQGHPARPGSLKAIVLTALAERGLLSRRDIMELGVSRQYISTMCTQGVIGRTGHGYYRVAERSL